MRNRILLLSVMLSTLGTLVAPTAFAAPRTIPADPTGGQMAIVQDKTQTWVLTYGVPVLFGLLILGILIRLGVKWARRAGSKI